MPRLQLERSLVVPRICDAARFSWELWRISHNAQSYSDSTSLFKAIALGTHSITMARSQYIAPPPRDVLTQK